MVYVSLLKDKVFRLFLSVLVFLLFYPIAGYSAIFNVTNEDELRQALSIAESNGEDDVINVEEGLYRTFGETFTFDTNEDFSLAIEGEGAGITILDGEGLSRVLSIQSNNENFLLSVSMRGLTIQNGFKSDDFEFLPDEDNGAGVSILKAGFVTIETCKFRNNTAEGGFGGGIYIVGESSPDNELTNVIIASSEFSNNFSNKGGGVYINFPRGILLIPNNKFSDNFTSGIHVIAAVSLIFSDNELVNNGEGASLRGTFLEIIDNKFRGNSNIGLSVTGDLYLSDNYIESNEGGGVDIGGFFSVRNSLITNNIFKGNSSVGNGGGLSIRAQGGLGVTVNSTITNNTFTLNTSENDGGAINFIARADLRGPPPTSPNLNVFLNIYNNIIYDNIALGNGDDISIFAESFFPSSLFFTVNLFNNDFSDLFVSSNCAPGTTCEPIINEGNNIDLDPLFVDAEAGDVSLLPDSACIDAGDPNAPDVPDTDIFGNPRVPPPDMGAVEYIEEAIKGGGGCSIAHNPVSSSLAVFLAIPFLILIRRFVKKYRI